MLICIGGFHGSGRRPLSQAFAKRFGYYYYDVNDRKLRRPVFRSDGVAEHLMHPNTDDERSFFYRRVLNDMPKLSIMYPNLILNDAFYRRKPREEFFKEARKYFDNVLVIWVECDDETAKKRLEARGPEAAASFEWGRGRAQKDFEPFAPAVPVFDNSLTVENKTEKFFEFMQKLI